MMKKTLLFSLTLIFGFNLRANYSFPAECLTDQFACDNKNCIPFVWKCDGSDDCGDNSDESQCITGLNTTQCKSDEMECKNKRCINLELKCDSRNDCGDGSDEENCNFDEPDQYCDLGTNFLCKNGKCISRSLTCNQVDNCLDNSDEAYNEDPYCSPTQGCRDGYYKCKKSGYCIQDSLVCDGVHFNCGENDDSDELGCKQKICTYGQFKCANGRCISSEMQCNKQNDCGDNSDEENCVYNACSGVKCPFYASCVLGFNQKARCYCTLECRPDYNPVCGSDLKTYRSECFMQVESCQAQKEIKVVPNIECKCAKMKCSHYGTCAMTWNGEIGCRCSRECSPERKPLCGSNYQTYRNKCYLKMDSCIKQKEIFVLYESPCKCSSMKCPHFGMCRTNSDGYAECVCTTECSPIRKPVCGSNFRTYRNICYLRMDSCMKKKHIAVLYKAGCGNIRIS